MSDYMTIQTTLPPYLPYPRFLLDKALSQTAKVIYAVLLDRATLSQANGWVDHSGRLYLIFPIAGIASTIGKSISTVKDALNELERAELVERKRRGLSMPNRIYMKLPSGQKSGFQQAGKLSVQEPENAPLEGGGTGFQTAGKAATNNLSKNHLNKSNLKGASARPYGRYQNVFLSDAELAELQTDFPAVWQEYIEKLSAYMESTGKAYRSHAVTIRRWVSKDERKATTARKRDYTASEEDTV